MSNSIYVYYDVINHTGMPSASGYTLPFCAFQFKPTFTNTQGIISNTTILWDFGDGTTSKALTATHNYSKPGSYVTTCYFYDNEGNAYSNTFSKVVDVHDYITDWIQLSTTSVAGIPLTASKITNPVRVTRWNSFQSYTPDKQYTIVPYASSTRLSPNYFDLPVNAYTHLSAFSSFYNRVMNPSGITEFVEISSINLTSQLLYCKLSGNQIVNSTDPNDTLCGTTGTDMIYFKDDMPHRRVDLLFGFDKDVFKNNNTSTVGVSARIQSNTDYQILSITSNGVDGEGVRLSAFNINTVKYINAPINFVVKIKDSDWYTVKNQTIASPNLTLKDNYNNTLPATFNISASSMGFIRGTVTSLSSVSAAHIQCSLLAGVSSVSLSGSSDTFEVDSSVPVIAKIGEDVDMLANYKQLRFQELFFDKVNLFDNFLGPIVGDISSDQNSIGKKVYEKIQNFVDNNSNVDKCNLAQLISLLECVGDNNILFEKSNFAFPAALKRLVDLLSIKHSYLFGAQNTFCADYRTFGNSTQYFGKNLGQKLNTLTYVVTGGHDIIAREKYSNTYKKLDSYIPLSSYSVQQRLTATPGTKYPLSAYANDWGWNLILNTGYTAYDLSKFYDFFTFVPTVYDAENIMNSTINFADQNTTLSFTNSSYTDWSKDNGLMDRMINYQLYRGLGIVGNLID